MSGGSTSATNEVATTDAGADVRQGLQTARMRAFGQLPQAANTQAAQGLQMDTLRGKYLGENPYIGGIINNAANTIQGQVQSRFGQAGRNVGGPGAQRQFADTLAQVAPNLMYQNYANERQLQNSQIGATSQFDPVQQYIQSIGYLAPAADRYGTTHTEDKASPLDRFLGFGSALMGL